MAFSGIRAVMRYLSALRAMIDALPRRLFLMIAVTPDALRRYSEHYPALRSRLQDRLELQSLSSAKAAKKLADFYLNEARKAASREEWRDRQRSTSHLESKKSQNALLCLRDRRKRVPTMV